MKETADEVLKGIYRRRENKQEDGEEPPWINEDIRIEIKERKRFNRNRRNAQGREEEERWKELYTEQKIKVQNMIRKEIYKHEEKLTREIRENKDGGRKMWEYIKKLKGEQVKEKGTLRLYGEDGVELERDKVEEEVKDFWGKIYRKYDNNVGEVWSMVEREEYTEYNKVKRDIENKWAIRLVRLGDVERARREYVETYGIEVREHMEMARKMEGGFIHLGTEDITRESVTKCLKRIKNKKAIGTDEIKGEFYKEFAKSRVLTEELVKHMNIVLETGNIPEEWKKSRTVMIPKTAKPTVKELRPIALTNVGCKLIDGSS